MNHTVEESLEWMDIVLLIARQNPEDYVFFYLPKEHVGYVDTGEAIVVWSWRKEAER